MAMQVALLIRWEWFKLSRRWLPWVMLGLTVVITQALFWAGVFFDDELSHRTLRENVANGLASGGSFAFMAMFLTIAVTGSEYGWGTMRPVLSRGVGRGQFLIAKLTMMMLATAAGLIIVAAAISVSSFFAGAVTTPEPLPGHGSPSWLDLLMLYGRVVYSFLPYIALGLFAVTLVPSEGPATGLTLGYYLVEQVIVLPLLVANISWADWLFAFLLGPIINAWQSLPSGLELDIATIGGMPEMAHGFIFVTLYTAALAAAAIALFMRRDIAGAKGG